jgi:sulfide:quinone oxidoreductase
MSAPEFIRTSSLASENGWLNVNHHTLQHNKFSNIFGIGDVCNLPTAKTAAAVFS